ncbi:glycosyltransferase family 39 protein [bacterium]|nr:glycosyltransferase family 39 protein [bacterium]
MNGILEFSKIFQKLIKSNYLIFGSLIILIILALFSGQYSIPPIDRDEARFAQASSQMIQSGDYVNIKFQDEIRAKKPIGIYWLQAFSGKIFSEENIGSYRIPSLLSSIITLVFVGLITRLIFPLYQTLIVTLLFATSIVFIGEAHLAKTDATLLCLICVQQYFLLKIILERDNTFKVKHLYPTIMWLAFSFGILVKGPVSIAILFSTVIAYSIIQKSKSLIKSLRPVLGFLICILVILPWFFAIDEATNGMFLQKAFQEDFFSKLESGQEGHGALPGTHLLSLSISIWPIATFLPCMILFSLENRNNIIIKFLICWILPFWVIIELIPTKLLHYPLPVLPAISILAIGGLLQFKSNVKKIKTVLLRKITHISFILFSLGGVILGGGIFYITYKFNIENDLILTFFTILLVLIGIVILILSLTLIFNFRILYLDISKNFYNILLVIIALGSVFNIINYKFVIPKLDYLYPSKTIIKELKKVKADAVASSGYHEPSLVFLLNGNVLLSNPHEVAIFMAEGTNNVALIEKSDLKQFLQATNELNLKIKEISIVKGFNIAKGRHVEIYIFQNQLFDLIN